MAEESELLPQNVAPKVYTLKLEPDLNAFTFKGLVTVDLDVVERTNEIEFHAHQLEISQVEVLTEGKLLAKTADGLHLTMDAKRTRALVKLESGVLEAGTSAQLKLTFTGILNDDMTGFYRASYMEGTEKRYMATTQFEAIGARRAFPCWDEPALKAIFRASILVPPGLTALSNMPEDRREDGEGGATLVTFKDSPKMSTYLLAFVVGDLERVQGKSKEGIEVNVYTIPGKKEQGRFALGAATDILSFFTEYFGIAYPLPKADLVGIPDFAMGAMENWGLITFRDIALLVDEKMTSTYTRQRVAYTVSHELAHQWFGNLVTMKWWNDLWLNEGFATWVGWYGVDLIHPEWNVWTQFVNDSMGSAFRTDALLGSHPVDVPIKHAEEIDQLFDALSYSKGACIVRQLEAAIGSEAFKKGLQIYLKRHQWGNTVTRDLWEATGEASGRPVAKMMHEWTNEMGFPVLTVSELSGGSGGVHLKQTRFLAKGAPTPEEDKVLWVVPVTAVNNAGSLPVFTLDEKEADAPELKVPEGGWLKLNAGQPGFFRVNYSAKLWDALGAAVKSGALGVVDRLGILMDAVAMARAGLNRTSQALDLSLAYKEEENYTVWCELLITWSSVGLLLSADEALLEKLYAIARKLLLPIAEKLGWEPVKGEEYGATMLRPLVLRRLGFYEHPPTVEECKRRFELLQKDTTVVPADFIELVCSVSIKYGGRAEFEAAKKMYKEGKTASFQLNCLSAMACTQDPELIREYLEYCMDENEVKAQNYP
eukprot:TRINITY_DN3929_c0_g1_i1.p1 TRINITY_DN3929_c0_g1~~TRINITY_DN3929_c0_g1_i1.p1  ORF type:complete len:766 (-),score=129.97 TRINITY_DN3929_c0_g1_i1:280-2577(-)